MKALGTLAALAATLCLSLACLCAHAQGRRAAPAAGDEATARSGDAQTGAEKAPAPAESKSKDVYEVDFRGKNFDRALLAPIGHKTLYGLTLLQPEEKGLRITIPDHQGEDKPYLGFAPAFEIQGDFEITASYEILATEIPKPVTGHDPFRGGGAGPNLYIVEKKTMSSATLRRCVTPTGTQAYLVHWVVRDEKGRRPWHGRSFAAPATTGKLRLARSGDTLRYLVAEQGSEEFIELHRAKFGTGPIAQLRVEAMTDASPTTVIIRWNDLRIEAEKLEPVEVPILASKAGS